MADEVTTETIETPPAGTEQPQSHDAPHAESSTAPTTGDAPAESPREPESKGVQKRIDELIRQREDQRREKTELMAMVKELVASRSPGGEINPNHIPFANGQDAPPQAKDYDGTPGKTWDDYIEHKTQHAVRQHVGRLNQQQQAENQQQSQTRTIQEWVNKGIEKHPDFVSSSQVAAPHVTPVMLQALVEEPDGHEAGYYLGQNPEEAQRIARLTPARQAIEIGRLCDKLKVSQSQARKETTAPPPPKPLGGGRTSATVNPENETADEYIARRRSEIAAKKKAGRR